jgi:UDP-N-acetylmuramate--alanine ligase
MLGRTRHIHFVGIGGIGMSGVAEVLANLGYTVTGSDAKASDVTRRLELLGVRVAEGHRAAQVGDADVVVVSSAIRPTNPEIVEARARGIPVIARAEMLAELMRLKHGIAVAGAHGKTTTTSMVALMLDRAGLDPTAVIGGRLSVFGSNARLGRGACMVVEADESDGSFLRFSPVIAIVTNLDREHLDHYGTFERVIDAFVEFANKVPFYGAVVACVDDPNVAALRPRVTRRVVTYGIDDPTADLRGEQVELQALAARCIVRAGSASRIAPPGEALGELRLNVPGRHNLLNALAAVGVGLELGLSFGVVAAALAEFRGAERRFQVLGESKGILIVDDYGHHPTEIAAVVDAARVARGRRLVVVFQPHRFSRTRELLSEFGKVLARADVVVLTDIYAAGEEPLEGVTVEAVAGAVTQAGGASPTIVKSLSDLPAAIVGLTRPGDLVVTLGAGSIGSVGPLLLDRLRREGAPA